MPDEKSGIFIVLDGIDGAGKTTQVKFLEKSLREAGEVVRTSKEPTNGQWGQMIRRSAQTGRMPIKEELNAFLLDREEHIEKIISPALDAGEIVILDRYYYSTICYQGARGEDTEELRNAVMSSAIIPDISFILDIDPELAQQRIADRDGLPNQFEAIDELRKVRANYDWLCHRDKELYELDGTQSIDLLHQTIVSILIDTVLLSKRCAKSYGCDDNLNCSFRLTNTCPWFNLRNKLLLGVGEVPNYPALKYHQRREVGRVGWITEEIM